MAEYNGWTNYETWNVALWIDNDQGSYNHWRAAAQEAWDEAEPTKTWTREESARFKLSEQLKDDIAVENQPELEGCYGDLLSAALSEVNWDEIAEHMIEDVEKIEAADADSV